MKQLRFLGLPLVCLVALASSAVAQDSMSVGTDTTEVGGVVSLPLEFSSEGEVQGFVFAFDWDGAVGTGVDVVSSAVIGDADVVARRIEADFAVLGVVLDVDGEGISALPPGTHTVAEVQIQCAGVPGESDVEFQDNTYSAVADGPILDNILVIGGLSIGVSDNLQLVNGHFSCTPPPDKFTIESVDTGGEPCAPVRILMTNNRPAEGFVIAVAHGAGVTLQDISVGQAVIDNGADFTASEIVNPAIGGTLGVVLDLFSPFDGNVIPPGGNQHVATFEYCCSPAADGETVDLEFLDGELGNPVKDNLIVVGGLSLGVSDGLVLQNGTITCTLGQLVEICDNGIDDDADNAVDCEDSDCVGTVACPSDITFVCGSRDGSPLEASAGGEVEVCFGLVINEDSAQGHAQPDHIQGFSMAVSFCDTLNCVENLDIGGTILEALGAEFVSIQCDNDVDDGDGKELIIGVLIDALPPFDGATIAPSFINEVQAIGYVTFIADPDAECDTACAIEFVDGLNGRGRVPIKNLISHENHSSTPSFHNCSVRIVAQERFFRGDCNFSVMGSMSVDISDAASVVSYLFLTGSWRFQPGCLDACDCQDDGRVDLADAVCILQFLFQFGAFPPAPGPGFSFDGDPTPPGADPTDDKLDCELGKECVLAPH